jgi:hypothetical protein
MDREISSENFQFESSKRFRVCSFVSELEISIKSRKIIRAHTLSLFNIFRSVTGKGADKK